MPLTLFYITNNPQVALIAEKYGVDRIWVDLETMGKEQRQKNMNTVKSHHTVGDVARIKPLLTKAELLVRVNPWHSGSETEIAAVLDAGADVIMLPMWTSADEVRRFVDAVGGRAKTSLLLETKEALACVDEVLTVPGVDEIHVGLNDLHLSCGRTFMFELLTDGTVEMLCRKFRTAGIPYGFGGIARLGEGLLQSEKVILEHYRLGSTRAILSRSFCNIDDTTELDDIDRLFAENMARLRAYETYASHAGDSVYGKNREDVVRCVNDVVAMLNGFRT